MWLVDRVNSQPAQWWVRSMADQDTHIGTYSPASRSVLATCGQEFVAQPVGWPARLGPLPGRPSDPDQICPTCYRSLMTSQAGYGHAANLNRQP